MGHPAGQAGEQKQGGGRARRAAESVAGGDHGQFVTGVESVALPLFHHGQGLHSRRRQVRPAAQAGQQPGGAGIALGVERVFKAGHRLARGHALGQLALCAEAAFACEQLFHALVAARHLGACTGRQGRRQTRMQRAGT